MSIFHMTDILPLLGLPQPPPGRRAYYIPCPRCDTGRDKHLNINVEKDVFNCPRCNFQGGIFDMYAYYANIPRSSVYKELQARLSPGGAQLKLSDSPGKKQSVPVKENDPAPIAIRDSAFRALLDKLSLAPDHEENLLSRGLSKEVIRRHPEILDHKTQIVIKSASPAGYSREKLKEIIAQILAEGGHLAHTNDSIQNDESVSESGGIDAMLDNLGIF